MRFLMKKFSFHTHLILFKNQIQTISASACRTQVLPAPIFLVCSLIFIEYKIQKGIYRFTDMYITDFYRSYIDRISSLGSFPF